jgi:hypothetical protein
VPENTGLQNPAFLEHTNQSPELNLVIGDVQQQLQKK